MAALLWRVQRLRANVCELSREKLASVVGMHIMATTRFCSERPELRRAMKEAMKRQMQARTSELLLRKSTCLKRE
eukprot:6193919-Pleurochrysis_carterae.AAC.3